MINEGTPYATWRYLKVHIFPIHVDILFWGFPGEQSSQIRLLPIHARSERRADLIFKEDYFYWLALVRATHVVVVI